MTTFKVALTYSNTLLLRKNVYLFPNVRNLSVNEITKNLALISNEKIKKNSSGKLILPEDKPLVISLTWLLAKRKTVLKYSSIYLDQGFDVLNLSIKPWQILWPVNGSQKVIGDLLTFLSTNYQQSPVLLHGFSVGAYMWGEALVQITNEPNKFKPIVDRVVGQIWDSAADITEIPVGLPFAVFPKNSVMQKALRYHMKTFHKVATSHYLRSSQMFHTNPVKVPALFFLSKTDPVGAFNSNMRVRESWESLNVPVYWKCWDRSPHVGHFKYHPDEYKKELYAFLDRLSLIAYPEKIKVHIRQ